METHSMIFAFFTFSNSILSAIISLFYISTFEPYSNDRGVQKHRVDNVLRLSRVGHVTLLKYTAWYSHLSNDYAHSVDVSESLDGIDRAP